MALVVTEELLGWAVTQERSGGTFHIRCDASVKPDLEKFVKKHLKHTPISSFCIGVWHKTL